MLIYSDKHFEEDLVEVGEDWWEKTTKLTPMLMVAKKKSIKIWPEKIYSKNPVIDSKILLKSKSILFISFRVQKADQWIAQEDNERKNNHTVCWHIQECV